MNGEWGFCRTCAFEVPVEGGRLVSHNRNVSMGGTFTCSGSGKEPTEQPGPDVEPLKLVLLTKSASYLALRRRRSEEAAKAKAMAFVAWKLRGS